MTKILAEYHILKRNQDTTISGRVNRTFEAIPVLILVE
jgi:hypothetical protein